MATKEQLSGAEEFARAAVEAAIRIGLIVLLLLACWLIVRPFVTAVAWGVILAIATYPGFHALKKALGNRDRLAAVVLTLVALVIFIGPVGMLATELVANLRALAADLSDGTVAIPPPPATVAGWPIIGEPLDRLWSLASVNLDEAMAEIAPQLKVIGTWLLGFVAGLGLGLVQFLLAIVIAGFLLAQTAAGGDIACAFSQRVAGRRGPELVKLTVATVRNVARGVLGTALVQATLAGIGLVAAGVPAAGLIAFLAFLLSALQIGVVPVMLPSIIYVFATASPTVAVLFTVWTIPVMLVDNILKPILMSRGADVPILVIFIGVIGGTLAAGIIGLFIGPVILALGYRLFWAWVQDAGEAVPASTV